MEYRDYEFILTTGKAVNIYKIRAYSLQEAISDIYIKISSLRQKDGKEWKIVKATDTTHFNNIKIL